MVGIRDGILPVELRSSHHYSNGQPDKIGLSGKCITKTRAHVLLSVVSLRMSIG